MIMKVIRDSSGKVINIGDWDYMEQAVVDDITGSESIVKINPLPVGATESHEEVSINSDGGRTAVAP